MITVKTSSPEQTQELAEALSGVFGSGDVVLMIGDMGSGKTTFVKGVGRAMGVVEPVTSPTFVLVHTYKGRLPLHHADLYRLETLDEVLDLGIPELLEDGGMALIEWADRGEAAFPFGALRMEFEYGEAENERVFRFNAVGDAWASRKQKLADVLSSWSVEP